MLIVHGCYSVGAEKAEFRRGFCGEAGLAVFNPEGLLSPAVKSLAVS
jgi:hypothetical protein